MKKSTAVALSMLLAWTATAIALAWVGGWGCLGIWAAFNAYIQIADRASNSLKAGGE